MRLFPYLCPPYFKFHVAKIREINEYSKFIELFFWQMFNDGRFLWGNRGKEGKERGRKGKKGEASESAT